MRVRSSILLSALVVGCARGPNVVSRDLPLRRVVVYRNGVGYFERAGHVERERVGFEMRQRLVGDFLASLAVIERGGSSVRSASFPLEVEDVNAPPTEPEPLPLAPDTAPSVPGARAPAPTPPPPPPKRPDPNRMREVVLHLDGKEHDLLIGYLSETPVWRPSYRVVVSDDAGADLQAWGIVQNLSGEDWSDVTLSLVAGAPLAFQSTLGTPVIPERPVVTDQGEVVAVVPTSVTSLDRSREPQPESAAPPGVANAPQADAPEDSFAEEDEKVEASRGAAMKKESSVARRLARPGKVGALGGAAAPPPPPRSAPASASAAAGLLAPEPSLSPPRRLSALAAVAIEAGSTRYDIPYPVTVPNESATMVLLTSQRVPGEAVLLFAPEPGVPESDSHPFRVVRFTNTTAGLLERGPIAVFERGSFLGQGMLDPLPPRATATVPFALERSVALLREHQQDERGARLYRIEAGQLFIERDVVLLSKYRVDNGGDKKLKVLVKHPRMAETRLYTPPAGTEDNAGTGAALVPREVRAHATAELVVDERRTRQQYVDWLAPLADDAVRGYLADPRANAEVARRLREAWVVRDELRTQRDELDKLDAERAELERLSEETRRNLRAIEKNTQAGELRQKLTKRIAEATTRLDVITKRSVELRMAVNEREIRFRDAIRELKLDSPLPVRD